MSVLAAVNLEDGLVLLEDGRELPISGFYANKTNPALGPLTAGSALLTSDRVNTWKEAEVFAVAFPGVDTALIVELAAIGYVKPSQIN